MSVRTGRWSAIAAAVCAVSGCDGDESSLSLLSLTPSSISSSISSPPPAAVSYGVTVLKQLTESESGKDGLVCPMPTRLIDWRAVMGLSCDTAGRALQKSQSGDPRFHVGGFVSAATAVNSSHVIVGYANTPDDQAIRAFRWTKVTGLEPLASLIEGVPAEPKAINDAGIVVGRAGTSFFSNAAVYWDQSGAIHTLPRLYDTPDISVLAINNRGDMVGQEMAPDLQPEARLWMHGSVYRLQDLVPRLSSEYRLRSATSINDRGDIVANASVLVEGQVKLVSVLLTANNVASR